MSAVPSVAKEIQIEETDFRSPGSESMLQKISGSQHYLLDASDQYAVGEIFESMLTEVQLQAILGSGYVLCDGRDVTGSKYEEITSSPFIPDARGIFLRNQQGSRSDGVGNVDGNLPIGTLQTDSVVEHSHSIIAAFNIMTFNGGQVSRPLVSTGTWINQLANFQVNIEPTTGNETRPKCVTVNVFIRIN